MMLARIRNKSQFDVNFLGFGALLILSRQRFADLVRCVGEPSCLRNKD